MRKQNLSVRLPAEQKSLDSGFVKVFPATQRPKSPTVGLSDPVPDLYWGSAQRAPQVLSAWFYCLALWNTCASESGGLGMIAT